MNSVYIILDGRALYLLEEPDGTRNLIGVIYAPHLFAFGLNYYNKPSTNISVISDDASTILSLNFNTTIEACENRCPFHKTIVNNLIGDLCHKNISCIEKMQHMGRSSIRAKVMSYLQAESKKRNSNDFYIPYNRQQLAEYFGIDRSALSKELSNMKTEGLIDYYKNYFVLLHPHNIS